MEYLSGETKTHFNLYIIIVSAALECLVVCV